MKCCPTNCNRHILVSSVGLALSSCELILAAVYNFHMLGFGFAIIGITCSSLYLHFNIRD